MRRFLSVLSAALVLAVLASPVDAQLKFGPQLAMITGIDEATSLDGSFGLGGRVMVDPPLMPVGGFVSATYYFPDDEGTTTDLSYWTATAAAQLRLPMPTVKPYALGGWQWRRSSVESSLGDFSGTENGPVLGIGVQLDFMMSAFLEATFEFNSDDDVEVPDFDNDPIVIKGGILFGG